MKTVFFKISDTQAKEVQTLMESEGYTSKAEFFRFLVKFFKYEKQSKGSRSLEEAVGKLEATVKELDEKGYFDNLPPLDEQLGL